MTKSILIYKYGGPEQMRWENVNIQSPGPRDVLIHQTAVGLNFIDIYYRNGTYSLPSLPSSLGFEGAGIVEVIGSEVNEVKVGDRVAYANGPIGSYSERRIIPSRNLVVLPDSLSDTKAASMMLKGLTSQYLLRKIYNVQSGDIILFHALAGGVGLIACQWAKHLGAIVIGTVKGYDKAMLVKSYGADYVIDYTIENFVTRVKEITCGKGVRVVYDSVGKDTFEGSLKCLQPRGLMVSFGQSSGIIPAFNVGTLATNGSLYLTRPTLETYINNRSELLTNVNELFDIVINKIVKIEINQTYKLSEVAQAHYELENRKTTGSTVLIV